MEHLPGPPSNVIDLGSDDDSVGSSEAEASEIDSGEVDSSDVDSGSDDASSNAETNESLIDNSDFADSLLDALEKISSDETGTFAHAAPISDAVFKDPKIYVNGFGTVSLPLSAQHAETLTALCHEGEMRPGDFRLDNPLWEQRVLPTLVDQAVAELSVPGKINGIGAQLRKMQLFRKEARTDTDEAYKTPGLIGRLLVCLPSPHQGGDVRTNLGSVKKELSSSGNEPSFMCWYHNSDHQMTEVISGYRLALVYDIINFEQPFLTTSVSKVSQQMDPLYDVFNTWKQTHEDLRHRYIYVLPNTYEDDDLNLDVLSGGDLAIARALKEVNRELSFTTFLARIESRKTGTLYDYDYDDYDTETVHEMEHVKRETLSLEEVTDLSGRSLVKDVSIKKEEVLQEDWTEYVNPEEIEYSYMESTATHVFRSAAIVMMSNNEAMSFLAHGRCPPDAMLGYLGQQELTNPDDPRVLRRYKDFLLRASADVRIDGDRRGTLESIVEATIALKDVDLFNSIALPTKTPLSSKVLSDLSDWIWESGFPPLQEGLEKLVPEHGIIFETHTFLKGLLGSKSHGETSLTIGTESGLFNFIEEKMQELLDKASRLFSEDCTALMEILEESRSFEETSAKLVDAVERNAKNTPVVLQLLEQLPVLTAKLPHGFVDRTFERIFKCMATHFSFRHDPAKFKKLEPKPEKPKYRWRPTPDPPRNTLWTPKPEDRHIPDSEWEMLAFVMTWALKLDLEDQVIHILQKLMRECNKIQRRDAETMLLPLVKSLPLVMKQEGLQTVESFPKLREFYQSFVQAYFSHSVGKEPQFDWARVPGKPNLKDKKVFLDDCHHLNEFLRDRQYVVGRFRLADYRQRKLQRYVPPDADCEYRRDNYGCVTITKKKSKWHMRRRQWADDCRIFVQNVKSLEENLDVKAVLGEIYERIVQHAELKAQESLDDEIGEILPEMIYEWDGQQASRPPPSESRPSASQSDHSGASAQDHTMPPIGTSQPTRPLEPTTGNILPPLNAPSTGVKRKAGEDPVDGKQPRGAVRRKT